MGVRKSAPPPLPPDMEDTLDILGQLPDGAMDSARYFDLGPALNLELPANYPVVGLAPALQAANNPFSPQLVSPAFSCAANVRGCMVRALLLVRTCCLPRTAYLRNILLHPQRHTSHPRPGNACSGGVHDCTVRRNTCMRNCMNCALPCGWLMPAPALASAGRSLHNAGRQRPAINAPAHNWVLLRQPGAPPGPAPLPQPTFSIS